MSIRRGYSTSGGGTAGHTIADGGSAVTQRATLNFDGTHFAVTDDAGNNETDVALTGVFGTTPGFISVGGTPATTGGVRLAFDTTRIYARNSGNTDNVLCIGLTSVSTPESYSNAVLIGDTQADAIQLVAAGGRKLTFDGTPDLYVNGTGGSPFTFRVLNDDGNLGFNIRAGGSTTTNGGELKLQGGRRGGTGNYGAVGLELNVDDSTFYRMVEACHLGNARRIVAMARAATLTTTEMPANTGDLVVYIGNCATAPTASSVSGGILYCEAGALKYRGTGGTVTTLGAA